MDTDPDIDTDLEDMAETKEGTEGSDSEPESDDFEAEDFNSDLLEDGSDGL